VTWIYAIVRSPAVKRRPPRLLRTRRVQVRPDTWPHRVWAEESSRPEQASCRRRRQVRLTAAGPGRGVDDGDGGGGGGGGVGDEATDRRRLRAPEVQRQPRLRWRRTAGRRRIGVAGGVWSGRGGDGRGWRRARDSGRSRRSSRRRPGRRQHRCCWPAYCSTATAGSAAWPARPPSAPSRVASSPRTESRWRLGRGWSWKTSRSMQPCNSVSYNQPSSPYLMPCAFLTTLCGGYNYDSTSIRLKFDRAATIGRLTVRPQVYLCAWAAVLGPK